MTRAHSSGLSFASFWPALALALVTFLAPAQAQTQSQQQQTRSDATLVDQGRRLAVAADCAACHTAAKGAAFAGGRPIGSPLGSVVASNITPSQVGGIGGYTLDDFTRSLRQGLRKDGAHLYPAMPYPAYALLSDADTAALYAYFMQGVAPVDQPAPQTELRFPFNLRGLMGGWNALFLKDARFVPDPAQPAEWNRGAYLVGALAHCSACHTPRNALMGEQKEAWLSGGSVGSWYAPNITSDPARGIGTWSEAELVQYLKTGRAEGKAQAAGPMAEVVEHSLQHLPEADVKAIAVYLKQTPTQPGSTLDASTGVATPTRFSYGAPSPAVLASGAVSGSVSGVVEPGLRIFNANCARCHRADGAGTGRDGFPSLFHNSATGGERPDNLIATILFGVSRTVGERTYAMPAFGKTATFANRLSDQEVAEVSNHVLRRYGNPALKVVASDVLVSRNGGAPPLLARVRPLIGPLIALLVAGLIALVLLRVRRIRRERSAHRSS